MSLRSSPLATSSTHSAWTGSVADDERRNQTLAPSGDTDTERGAPRVNRRVIAWRRGNDEAGTEGDEAAGMVPTLPVECSGPFSLFSPLATG